MRSSAATTPRARLAPSSQQAHMHALKVDDSAQLGVAAGCATYPWCQPTTFIRLQLSLPRIPNERSIPSSISLQYSIMEMDRPLLDADAVSAVSAISSLPATSRPTSPAPYQVTGDDTQPGEASAQSEVPRRRFEWTTFFADITTILAPVALLGFLISVWRLDGQPLEASSMDAWRNAINVVSATRRTQFSSPHSDRLTRVTQLATIFPILFASTIGRLTSMMARWHLEKGTTMGKLEQLLGSRTFGATILTLFEHRASSLLAVMLVVIWAFSPFGTQSLLRMLATRAAYGSSMTEVAYFDTDGQSMAPSLVLPQFNLPMYLDRSRDSVESIVGTMYSANLMAPDATKLGSMDLWGNVKIPFLTNKEESWQTTELSSDDDGRHYYSSLAGLPIRGLERGNTSFTLESSYTHFECEDMTEFETQEDMFKIVSWQSGLPNGSWYGHASENNSIQTVTWSFGVDRLVDEQWYEIERDHPMLDQQYRPAFLQNETGIDAGTARLLFQTRRHRLRSASWTTCDIGMKYVESRVSCSLSKAILQPNCTVIEQRPSKKQHASEMVNPLSFSPVLTPFSKYFPMGIGVNVDADTDAALHYLTDPGMRTLSNETTLVNVSKEDFGIRFSQLFNTYMIASQIMTSEKSGVAFNADQPLVNRIEVSGQNRRYTEVFSISLPWIIGWLVSCIVLLLGGVASTVYAHILYGPDVLGFASTIVRDSQFIEVPPQVVWKDGGEVTMAMKNLRVRLGLTQAAGRGQPLLGVGYESETEMIKDVVSRKTPQVKA